MTISPTAAAVHVGLMSTLTTSYEARAVGPRHYASPAGGMHFSNRRNNAGRRCKTIAIARATIDPALVKLTRERETRSRAPYIVFLATRGDDDTSLTHSFTHTLGAKCGPRICHRCCLRRQPGDPAGERVLAGLPERSLIRSPVTRRRRRARNPSPMRYAEDVEDHRQVSTGRARRERFVLEPAISGSWWNLLTS